MRIRYILLILMFILFSSASFAQNQNIEINISMENTDLSGRKDLPVKVKITNKAQDDLDTEILREIVFCFSKRLKCNEPGIRGEHYIAFTKIPQKLLRNNESFEFEVNLADLYWKDAISSTRDLNTPKNFDTIPAKNHILSAVVSVFSHSITINGMNIPVSKIFASNQILTTLKP